MMQTNLQLDLAFNYLENTGTNIFRDFPQADDCGSAYRSSGD